MNTNTKWVTFSKAYAYYLSATEEPKSKAWFRLEISKGGKGAFRVQKREISGKTRYLIDCESIDAFLTATPLPEETAPLKIAFFKWRPFFPANFSFQDLVDMVSSGGLVPNNGEISFREITRVFRSETVIPENSSSDSSDSLPAAEAYTIYQNLCKEPLAYSGFRRLLQKGVIQGSKSSNEWYISRQSIEKFLSKHPTGRLRSLTRSDEKSPNVETTQDPEECSNFEAVQGSAEDTSILFVRGCSTDLKSAIERFCDEHHISSIAQGARTLLDSYLRELGYLPKKRLLGDI